MNSEPIISSDKDSFESLAEELTEFVLEPGGFNLLRSIGTGGFAEVFLAEELSTQRLCAVKKITGCLKGRKLKYFCREVRILSKCDNKFLLPFIGFTIRQPFYIVTEYIPNGSLYDAIHHRNNIPELTSTQKTCIVMGIACGMERVHELNAIHRDLKSLNILLDNSYYPIICDFGVARFIPDELQLGTKEIGTPNWMAPELFETRDYDNKVDVYSFGIMLWELLTNEVPFKGKTSMQIMRSVCDKRERPQIPESTNESMRNLIQLCWHQNPIERPPFSRIFKLFKKKVVMFDGTDVDQLDKFIKMITTPNFVTRSNIHNFEQLENANSPNYQKHLKQAFDSITLNRSYDLFSTISKLLHFKSVTIHEEMIVLELIRLLRRDENFIIPFNESRICFEFPYDNEGLIEHIIRLFIITNNSHNFLDKILPYISKFPKQILSLLFKEKEYDLLIKYSPQLIEAGCGADLLKVLRFLLTFNEIESASCQLVLEHIFRSDDIELKKQAFEFVCTDTDQKVIIDFSFILDSLKIDELLHGALSVILRMDSFPVNNSLILCLIKCITQDRLAFYILCQLAENQHIAKMIIQNIELCQPDDSVELLGVIFTNESYDQVILGYEDKLIQLLKLSVNHFDHDLFIKVVQKLENHMREQNTGFVQIIIDSDNTVETGLFPNSIQTENPFSHIMQCDSGIPAS